MITYMLREGMWLRTCSGRVCGYVHAQGGYVITYMLREGM